jgi:predicted transcriptional regulator
MEDERVYELLKKLWEQNIKPHMVFLILKTHADGEYHRGKELVDRGYDITEVYDTIEILVAKGDLTRSGKKTIITEKGRRILECIEELIAIGEKLVIT